MHGFLADRRHGAGQILFAAAFGSRVIALGRIYNDIRGNTASLDGLARWRVIQRRCHLKAAFQGQRQDRLHRALAERAAAHQGGAAVILKGAGDNLRRRGRARIDQHHHRQTIGKIAR